MSGSDLPTSPAGLADALLAELRQRANADNAAGMARFGISAAGTLGVTVADVRALARDGARTLGRDADALHELSKLLWASGVHEARIMATVLDTPEHVTRLQAESWAADLDSWDVCDQLCSNLLWRVGFAWDLPPSWSTRPETFVKRAGLVLIAQLALKDKHAADSRVIGLLGLVTEAAFDGRNDVKKAASWAFRQVGKRSAACHAEAVIAAEQMLEGVPTRGGTPEEAAARWVARDALRELRSPAVRDRLNAT